MEPSSPYHPLYFHSLEGGRKDAPESEMGILGLRNEGRPSQVSRERERESELRFKLRGLEGPGKQHDHSLISDGPFLGD
ncbi:hypothetical protein CDAR_589121 [Caerostris darwini]|uniref:Uncharacterized protein n=1 Tax=Caerostris darwini TaxID=1538125 RepID=A0AAV4T634_9ARAC|nr:hypothetical protein CDAR_589121 [Caerostris darwini]